MNVSSTRSLKWVMSKEKELTKLGEYVQKLLLRDVKGASDQWKKISLKCLKIKPGRSAFLQVLDISASISGVLLHLGHTSLTKEEFLETKIANIKGDLLKRGIVMPEEKSTPLQTQK